MGAQKRSEMGLVKSVKRRWLLSRDHPIANRHKIFFASKARRAELYEAKFGTFNRGGTWGRAGGRPGLQEITRIVGQHVDPGWYRTRHRLPDDADAAAHFLEHGLGLGLAPSQALSDENDRIVPWALEYFARMGATLGSAPVKPTRPGALSAGRILGNKNTRGVELAVVTANFGGYDRLLPVRPDWTRGADFFVATDMEFGETGAWRPLALNFHHPDPRRKARFLKLHLPTYFREYRRVLWIDSNVLLCGDPFGILKEYGVWDSEFATFRHWQRANLVDEAAACVMLGKEDPSTVSEHLEMVARHGDPSRRHVFATMVMMLDPNSANVRRMSDTWWSFMVRGSKRDQLSLSEAIAGTPDLHWKFFPEDSIEMSRNFVRLRHAGTT